MTRWNIAVCNFLICLGCVAPRSLRNVLWNWLECSDKSLPGDHYLDFGNNYGLHFPRTLIGEAKVHSSSDILLLCHSRSPNFWYQCKLTQYPVKSRYHSFSYESHKLRPLPYHRQDLFGDNFYLESFWLKSLSQMCFHISLVTFWNMAHIIWLILSIEHNRDIKIFLNHTIIIFSTIICCITPRTIWIIIWISAIIIIIFLSKTLILISNSGIAILPIAADFVA